MYKYRLNSPVNPAVSRPSYLRHYTVKMNPAMSVPDLEAYERGKAGKTELDAMKRRIKERPILRMLRNPSKDIAML